MSNNLWNLIQQATKGKKYLHVPLDQQEAMQSDRSYLRIFIVEMFLESTFAWFKTCTRRSALACSSSSATSRRPSSHAWCGPPASAT